MTTCIAPPELDEIELLTFVDGEADARVTAHIERCPHCSKRAQHLRHLQGRLTTRLYRVTCPPTVELGEYHLGLLPSEQAASVAQHLAECPRCSHEVAQLEDYLDELAPALEPSPLVEMKERVKVFVARLVQGGQETQSPLTPAPVGVRGEAAGLYIYQAGDVEITIEVQDDAEHPGHKVILGLITGLQDAQALEVHVWRGDERVTTEAVDDLGNFIVPNLPPTDYELILSTPETEIHIQDLAVGHS